MDFLAFPTYSFLLGSQVKSAIGFSLSLPRSQTLIPFSVAAETHCNLGLNWIWLMVDPASMVLMGSLRSVTSQTFNYLSLPPVARYLELGEMATVLTDPSWGLKVALI